MKKLYGLPVSASADEPKIWHRSVPSVDKSAGWYPKATHVSAKLHRFLHASTVATLSTVTPILYAGLPFVDANGPSNSVSTQSGGVVVVDVAVMVVDVLVVDVLVVAVVVVVVVVAVVNVEVVFVHSPQSAGHDPDGRNGQSFWGVVSHDGGSGSPLHASWVVVAVLVSVVVPVDVPVVVEHVPHVSGHCIRTTSNFSQKDSSESHSSRSSLPLQRRIVVVGVVGVDVVVSGQIPHNAGHRSLTFSPTIGSVQLAAEYSSAHSDGSTWPLLHL